MHKEGWEGTFDPGTNSHTKSLGSSKFDSGSNSVWEVIESANPAPFLGATEKVPLRRASVDSGSLGAHATIVQPAGGASVPAGLKQGEQRVIPVLLNTSYLFNLRQSFQPALGNRSIC